MKGARWSNHSPPCRTSFLTLSYPCPTPCPTMSDLSYHVQPLILPSPTSDGAGVRHGSQPCLHCFGSSAGTSPATSEDGGNQHVRRQQGDASTRGGWSHVRHRQRLSHHIGGLPQVHHDSSLGLGCLSGNLGSWLICLCVRVLRHISCCSGFGPSCRLLGSACVAALVSAIALLFPDTLMTSPRAVWLFTTRVTSYAWRSGN